MCLSEAHLLVTIFDLSSSSLRHSGCAQGQNLWNVPSLGATNKLSFCSICTIHPEFARGDWGRSAWPPSCCCLTTLSAVETTLWQQQQAKGESSWRDGHRATCPGTGLVLGDRVGTAATLRCNFAAFYLKTALSQEKWVLLGMTVASGSPGEDRAGGKHHRRGPEQGREWRAPAALSVTGHPRLRPS